MEIEDIDILFTYHPAPNVDVKKFEDIRDAAKKLGILILKHGEQKKDKERAIEKLRESIYYSIASIVVPPLKD